MSKNFPEKKPILISETNFVLDIAFEQSDECSRLLDFIDTNNKRLNPYSSYTRINDKSRIERFKENSSLQTSGQDDI